MSQALDVQARDRRATALTFITFVAMALIAYLGLVVSFGFPDVLRLSAPEILAAFKAKEIVVRSFYYIFAIAHLVFAAGVLLLSRSLRSADGPGLTIATGGGVLYGVAQTAGFLRWPFLVPLFSERVAGTTEHAIDPEVTLLVLESFHRYAGVAIGENLSFWGLAVWLIGIGLVLQGPVFGRTLLGRLWCIAGLMVFAYTFEQFGGVFEKLAPLLLLSHGLMYGLVLGISWVLLKSCTQSKDLALTGPTATLLISLFCAALVLPGLM